MRPKLTLWVSVVAWCSLVASAEVPKNAISDIEAIHKINGIAIFFPNTEHFDLSTLGKGSRIEIDSAELTVRDQRLQTIADVVASVSDRNQTRCANEDKPLGVLRMEYKSGESLDYVVTKHQIRDASMKRCFGQAVSISKVVALFEE